MSLYAKAADDTLGATVTTTLNRGTFERTTTGMACVFTFTLPRPDRTAAWYRLTVTARKSSVDVRTHYWDYPAARIFDGGSIEVEA